MRLHEIVKANEDVATSIDTEQILKYKRSLMTLFGCDAFLMVTDVFNACSFGKIISIGDGFAESVIDYVNTIPDLSEQERTEQIELISFQSIQLKDL